MALITAMMLLPSCSSQASHLGKILDGSSPPAACLAPPSSMKANPQGGSFQASSHKISIRHHGIFRNRALPSCSDGQPGAMVTACGAVKVSEALRSLSHVAAGLLPSFLSSDRNCRSAYRQEKVVLKPRLQI